MYDSVKRTDFAHEPGGGAGGGHGETQVWSDADDEYDDEHDEHDEHENGSGDGLVTRRGGGGGSGGDGASNRVDDGKWHHIAATRHMSSGRITLYVRMWMDVFSYGRNH